jgi:hypothetical protein
MLKAFVGVASKQGLAILQPEGEETLSLVLRAVRAGTRRVGFWVVLDDSDAPAVRALFLRGHRYEAMMLLDRSAKYLGRILPSDTDRSTLH